MVNQIVLLINLIGLLLADVLLLSGVVVTQNVPATLAPGSEVRVIVNVTKGDLSGFAKLQLDLPPGLTATAIETKGASFTFADGKAKFIWMSLPSTPTFRVSYTLSADPSAFGRKEVHGRLSYIEDNERKTHDMPVAVVAVGGDAIAASTIGDELVTAAGGAPVDIAGDYAMDTGTGTSTPTKAMQGAGGVTATRSVTALGEKEMLVEVTVRKGDIRGFGKLQETIPAGFTAVEKESDEAIFTAQDRVVKFVWLNLPARGEVRVAYLVRANDQPHGDYTIDGEFGYLLNDETQRAVLGSTTFPTGPRALRALASDEHGVEKIDGADAELALRERQKAEAEKRARELRTMDPDKHDVKALEGQDAELALRERQKAEAEKRAREEKEAKALAAQRAKEDKIAAAQRAKEEKEAKEAARAQKQPTPRAIPEPEKGILYKVQITAAHREVGKPYFIARHRYPGDFSIERHEGWIKYVTGRFSTYRDARDQRVSFVDAGHNFPGPFVTAYNDGVRITVQEALMISNQQWVQ